MSECCIANITPSAQFFFLDRQNSVDYSTAALHYARGNQRAGLVATELAF
jgi:hypothetical protein